MIVIPNTDLLGDHQTELAEHLDECAYAVMSNTEYDFTSNSPLKSAPCILTNVLVFPISKKPWSNQIALRQAQTTTWAICSPPYLRLLPHDFGR